MGPKATGWLLPSHLLEASSRDCPFIPEARGFWKPQACPFQDSEATGYCITGQQIPHLPKVQARGFGGSTEEGTLGPRGGGVHKGQHE